jgi:excisionase family DNA binding protein
MRASATCVSRRKKRTADRNVAAVESVEALAARGVLALTKAQVAAALQVTYRTVTEMIRRREIPFFRIGGKHVRIRIEEAMKRMEAQAEVAR